MRYHLHLYFSVSFFSLKLFYSAFHYQFQDHLQYNVHTNIIMYAFLQRTIFVR